MSKFFKPLSSFFFGDGEPKSVKLSVESEKKQDEPGAESGDNQDEPGGVADKNQDEPDGQPDAEAIVTIKKSEHEAFLALDNELKKFGSTADERSKLLTDLGTLRTWYGNAAKAGATTKQDANATEKQPAKKVSKATQEAIDRKKAK
jgi:hypothetical protein